MLFFCFFFKCALKSITDLQRIVFYFTHQRRYIYDCAMILFLISDSSHLKFCSEDCIFFMLMWKVKLYNVSSILLIWYIKLVACLQLLKTISFPVSFNRWVVEYPLIRFYLQFYCQEQCLYLLGLWRDTLTLRITILVTRMYLMFEIYLNFFNLPFHGAHEDELTYPWAYLHNKSVRCYIYLFVCF